MGQELSKGLECIGTVWNSVFPRERFTHKARPPACRHQKSSAANGMMIVHWGEQHSMADLKIFKPEATFCMQFPPENNSVFLSPLLQRAGDFQRGQGADVWLLPSPHIFISSRLWVRKREGPQAVRSLSITLCPSPTGTLVPSSCVAASHPATLQSGFLWETFKDPQGGLAVQQREL